MISDEHAINDRMTLSKLSDQVLNLVVNNSARSLLFWNVVDSKVCYPLLVVFEWDPEAYTLHLASSWLASFFIGWHVISESSSQSKCVYQTAGEFFYDSFYTVISWQHSLLLLQSIPKAIFHTVSWRFSSDLYSTKHNLIEGNKTIRSWICDTVTCFPLIVRQMFGVE